MKAGKGYGRVRIGVKSHRAYLKRILSGQQKSQNLFDYAVLNPELVETIARGLE